MRLYGLVIALAALFVFCPPKTASAQYTYVHNDAEYSINLPDAPTAVTIWGGDENIPYLTTPPKNGFVGEKARYRRVDPDTLEFIDVTVTFLKADRDFLLTLTQQKMEDTLNAEYKDMFLDGKGLNYSGGTDTLKWATLTAYSVDINNNVLYNAAHYLAGLETITVIKIQYSLKNKEYNKNYLNISKSIQYAGK